MKRDTDGSNHTFDIADHLRVWKAQYAVTGIAHEFVSINVTLGRDIVRMAVQFHNQVALAAKKIGEEGSDWHLPTELCSELRAR